MLDQKVFLLDSSEMYLVIFFDCLYENCKSDSESPISMYLMKTTGLGSGLESERELQNYNNL